jgi:hypothetical protein
MTAPARKTRQRPAPGQREASPSRHAGNTNSPETALIAPSPIEVLAAQFAEMQADMRQMRARVDAMSPPPLALAPASTRARMASRLALVFIGATERQDRTAFRVKIDVRSSAVALSFAIVAGDRG